VLCLLDLDSPLQQLRCVFLELRGGLSLLPGVLQEQGDDSLVALPLRPADQPR